MSIAGTYDVSLDTPMGEQQGVASFVADESTFNGRFESPLGALDIVDGRIEGDQLTWVMELTSPMRMKLDCAATIAGDTLTGTVKAGLFGTMKLNGERRA